MAKLEFSRDPCICTHVGFAHAPEPPSVCLRCTCDEFVKETSVPRRRATSGRPGRNAEAWADRDEDLWLDKM